MKIFKFVSIPWLILFLSCANSVGPDFERPNDDNFVLVTEKEDIVGTYRFFAEKYQETEIVQENYQFVSKKTGRYKYAFKNYDKLWAEYQYIVITENETMHYSVDTNSTCLKGPVDASGLKDYEKIKKALGSTRVLSLSAISTFLSTGSNTQIFMAGDTLKVNNTADPDDSSGFYYVRYDLFDEELCRDQ